MEQEGFEFFPPSKPPKDFTDSEFNEAIRQEFTTLKQFVFGHPLCDLRQNPRTETERFSTWTKNYPNITKKPSV